MVPGYRMLQRLGAGGFAEVWQAEHESLELVRAVKVLHPAEVFEVMGRQSAGDGPSYQRIVERFTEEARALAQLNHPHIVRFFDIHRTLDGRPCLSLEYCVESLASRLGIVGTAGVGTASVAARPQSTLGWADARDIVGQLLDGLAYLHERDRIHRDVKPANVLLGTDGDWKLSDFGLVKDISPSQVERSTHVVGSAYYLAPEARRGEAEPRSDLWSVGALLFRCLTGEDYYGGMEGAEEEWPDVPASLWMTLGRALERRPTRRFESAEAMREALFPVGSGEARGVRRDTGTRTGKGRDALGQLSEALPDGFVLIRAGRFRMGSPESEVGRHGYETQHEAVITRDFFLGQSPVRQRDWVALMGANPSHFGGDDRPVDTVSWYDAVAYCNALSEREAIEPAYAVRGVSGRPGHEGFQIAECRFKGLDATGYRLPTEAEWEYACRAGTTSAHYAGNDEGQLDAIGWFAGNSDGETHPIGRRRPNEWGLYDMLGNVFEWCWDWWDAYPAGSATDPFGPSGGQYRVYRGGCWYDGAPSARSAYRLNYSPGHRLNVIGFRLAKSAP